MKNLRTTLETQMKHLNMKIHMTNIQNMLSGVTPTNHFLALLPHEIHETHMKKTNIKQASKHSDR